MVPPQFETFFVTSATVSSALIGLLFVSISIMPERIFGPIGMRDTGFALTADHRARLVGMHARSEDGRLGPISFEIPQEPEFQMGGGGLYGTAADYLAFQQIFLNQGRAGGRQVLRPETVRLMSQNAVGDLNVRRLETAVPAYSNDAEFFPGMVKKWGLGFMISTEAAPGGRSPAEDEQGHAEGCHRLAAAVAEWLAQRD